ncbi:peptidase S8, partial [Bacillus haynesii]|nr:peptidase S8 [Bacillus haynesii]
MNKRIMKSSIAFFLLVALIFGQLPLLPKTMAAEDSVPISETTLTGASPVEASFQSEDEVHWYKINPSNQEIANYTHFRVKLKSAAELNISVYSSLENATDQQTFDRYNGYSYENNPALIDFPIAWKGPYYIKVENHHDEENETTSITDISYTISYEGVTLPPSNQEAEEECPAELSVSERETGKGILKQLRTIRDEVLSKTEKGKELSSFYYKAAPFISAKMLFNKSMRDSVYKDLVQLKPLFADVAKNGQESAHTITNDDQKAISRLYETARASVPESLKKQ